MVNVVRRLKRFQRLLAGSGLMPASLRRTLEAEGLWLLAEGLPGTITYRDYRAPDQLMPKRRVSICGGVALTHERLVVWDGRGRYMELPLVRPARPSVVVTADRPDQITFTYDARAFDRDRIGQVVLSMRTAQATLIAERVNGGHHVGGDVPRRQTVASRG